MSTPVSHRFNSISRLQKEKKMEEKKEWTKPQLIILGRGKPEESVLKNCKQKQAVSLLTDTSVLR
jgi:hypothetical protein